MESPRAWNPVTSGAGAYRSSRLCWPYRSQRVWPPGQTHRQCANFRRVKQPLGKGRGDATACAPCPYLRPAASRASAARASWAR